VVIFYDFFLFTASFCSFYVRTFVIQPACSCAILRESAGCEELVSIEAVRMNCNATK